LGASLLRRLTVLGRYCRLVDPDLGGRLLCDWRSVRKAFRVLVEREFEDDVSFGGPGLGVPVVDIARCVKLEAIVPMVVIVPVEKVAAVMACILDATEALGELGSVLEGLELGL
jgi:hypothetical protein